MIQTISTPEQTLKDQLRQMCQQHSLHDILEALADLVDETRSQNEVVGLLEDAALATKNVR